MSDRLSGTAPSAGGGSSREVALPGVPMKRKGNLMILGVVLVMISGFGFWFVLRSVDHRQEYLVSARDIGRWDTMHPGDFKTVLADLGAASGMTEGQLGAIVGKVAAGIIPKDTVVTGGMFRDLPLSAEDESGKVLIDVSLPANEAAFGTLETGDRVALLGQTAGDSGGVGDRYPRVGFHAGWSVILPG